MYRIDRSGEAVRELQRNLGLLESASLSIVPTGIFDTETEEAVKEYQRESALPVTGIADYLTFIGIYEKSSEDERERERTKKYRGTPFPITMGDSGAPVYNLNVMLSDILSHYGLFYYNEVIGRFDGTTREAVNAAEALFGYEETGEVNSRLYERIELEYLSIKQ